MHVGDDRALWLEALDPRQSVTDAEMARMGRITQAVDDPQIKAIKERPAYFRNVVDIGRVSRIANPIAKRGNVPVDEVERRERHRPALPFDGPAFAALN